MRDPTSFAPCRPRPRRRIAGSRRRRAARRPDPHHRPLRRRRLHRCRGAAGDAGPDPALRPAGGGGEPLRRRRLDRHRCGRQGGARWPHLAAHLRQPRDPAGAAAEPALQPDQGSRPGHADRRRALCPRHAAGQALSQPDRSGGGGEGEAGWRLLWLHRQRHARPPHDDAAAGAHRHLHAASGLSRRRAGGERHHRRAYRGDDRQRRAAGAAYQRRQPAGHRPVRAGAAAGAEGYRRPRRNPASPGCRRRPGGACSPRPARRRRWSPG